MNSEICYCNNLASWHLWRIQNKEKYQLWRVKRSKKAKDVGGTNCGRKRIPGSALERERMLGNTDRPNGSATSSAVESKLEAEKSSE